MSCNKSEKKLNVEIDDMKIKAHLDTSLDLSGIKVSEELILRTLAAIKEQSAESNDNTEETSKEQIGSRIIPWNRYVRGLATACAAVILVVAGYAAIKQFPVSMKSASDTTVEENSMQSTKDAVERTYTAAGNANAKKREADASGTLGDSKVAASDDVTKYSLTEAPSKADAGAVGTIAKDDTADTTLGASANDSSMGGGGGSGENGTAKSSDQEDRSIKSEGFVGEEEKTSDALRSSDVEEAIYTFRNIFVPSPEQAAYITITDNLSNNSVKLSEQSDIQAFYDVMDDHEFTTSGTDNTGDQDFTIEMLNSDTQMLITMLVGKYLTVRYTQGDTTSESIYYAKDEDLFQGDVETLYLNYSK